jgi:hypothetical protein
MHFWHSLLTLLVVAQLGRAQNQTDNCGTAAAAYSDCLLAAAGEGQTDDLSAACSECQDAQDSIVDGLPDTASCNELLEANCNYITACLSVCSTVCEPEYVAAQLCLLPALVIGSPNCDYQCVAGDANATTGSASGTTGNLTSSPIVNNGTDSGEGEVSHSSECTDLLRKSGLVRKLR